MILNRVGSQRHERVLKDAIEPLGIGVFGAIRRTEAAATPSRHLGLVPAAERRAAAERAIAELADLIASSCDLDGLRALAGTAPPLASSAWDPHAALAAAQSSVSSGGPAGFPRTGPLPPAGLKSEAGSPHDQDVLAGLGRLPGAGAPAGQPSAWGPAASARPWPQSRFTNQAPGYAHDAKPLVAVAQGPAFTFSYTEHAELLEAAGAHVVPFDPLTQEALPGGTAGLVIGGGFPEMYAPELSGNAPLRRQVAAAAAAGAPVIAECAGLLYLARTLDGMPMCGVVDADTHMTDRLTLGYRTAAAATDSVLATAGSRVRGHEFHRTAVKPAFGRLPAWQFAGGRAAAGRAEGHVVGNVVASYLHLHWAGTPSLALRFVAACRARVSASAARGGAARPPASGPSRPGISGAAS